LREIQSFPLFSASEKFKYIWLDLKPSSKSNLAGRILRDAGRTLSPLAMDNAATVWAYCNSMKRKSSLFIAGSIFLIVAISATAQVLWAQTLPRAIVLAWDGTVPSFVHEMLNQGRLPNLAKLIAGGAFADEVMPVYPSKTAPGFASLWSGAPPRDTGISGNRQPRAPASQHTILESNSAFLNAPLRAEPIWAAALRVGREVVLAHAPLGRELSDGAVKLLGYDGYEGRDGVISSRAAQLHPATSWNNLPPSRKPPLEIHFTISASPFFGLFIDDPADSKLGYNTLLVTASRDGMDARTTIKAGETNLKHGLWSGTIEVMTSRGESASVYLRLFDLKPDASEFMLYHTRPARPLIFPTDLAAGYREAAGAFIGNGASLLYQGGALGPTLAGGGDGAAEARYLETARMAQRQLRQTALWAIRANPWDLLFLYTPFPDEAEHLWRGYIDPATAANKKLAATVRLLLQEIYKLSDDMLGAVLANRPDNTLVALVSDHGMEGVNKGVAINRVLQREGLLVLNDKGQPDLARTKAFYPPVDNGYLLINSSNRKNGIVTQAERAGVVKQVREALLGIRDGGKAVVTAVYDAQRDGARLGIGGDTGGDIYLDLLPGYDFDARTGVGEIIKSRDPHGMHGFNPERPSMRTIMALNGPGVAVGKRIKNARLIDFAPTLAKLLGLPVPKNASGHVLQESLIEAH
jgi:predicted AlkP superfamily phosphohydrolase/phosphomutase